jgi:phenylalanyl-tRNA synthetase beta chain
MKISYNWLQSYFSEKLPEPKELAEALIFHAFEVESVEPIESDFVLDVKVLPDRAHYALSHKGIAYEASAITGCPRKPEMTFSCRVTDTATAPTITIEDTKHCYLHVGRLIKGIQVMESPDWLKERLHAVGQRSINNIVDLTNFVMFDIGQPLHAFDADKIKGSVTIRSAKAGETVTTLDGKVITLDSSILVIADEEGPLDIAGIKGGKKAELDSNTKNILLSAANFDAVTIRKATVKTGIKTDASKRFENSVPLEFAEKAIAEMSALLEEILPTAEIGPVVVSGVTVSPEQAKLVTSTLAINQLLGTSLTSEKILEVLKRLDIGATVQEDNFELAIPTWRSDLNNTSEIAEEVARIVGYETFDAPLVSRLDTIPVIDRELFYNMCIKKTLKDLGFSEVLTSSFSDHGDIEIEKSLASDKNFLRTNIRENLERAVELNATNVGLLGINDVKIFEIGTTFDNDGQHLVLALAVRKIKKEKGITAESVLSEAVQKIEEVLGELSGKSNVAGVNSSYEAKLNTAIGIAPKPESWQDLGSPQNIVKFKKFSTYPFIVRDIALFVSLQDSEDNVFDVLQVTACNSAGGLLVKGPTCFDRFEKGDKKSLAFRLIFQSFEKTLTDDEVNKIMETVYEAVKGKGWEVR